MTNVQAGIVAAVKTAVKGCAEVVGTYPHDCGNIANHVSAVMVCTGDETWEPSQGSLYVGDITVQVHLYIQTGVNPALAVTALQAAVNTALLTDLTLGGAITCLTPESVTAGEWSDEADVHNTCISDGFIHRLLTYNARVRVGG